MQSSGVSNRAAPVVPQGPGKCPTLLHLVLPHGGQVWAPHGAFVVTSYVPSFGGACAAANGYESSGEI
jgi:hypothetical protein